METVKQSGVFFMVALPCRYIPAVRRAKDLLEQGVIGDLVAVNATNRGACPGGWFIDPAISGGGAIMDHSAHAADLVRWLAGSDFDQVMALSGSNFLGLEIEDSGLVQFKLENSVIGVIDTSWSRQAPMPSTFDITLRLMGTHGTIWVDALSQRIDVYAGDTQWVVYGGSIDDAMINDFVTSVRNQLPTPITVQDGYQASLISLCAYESIRKGEFVSVTSDASKASLL